jgi:hypothetical protein
VANNRYANGTRRKRQEKRRKRQKVSSLPPPAPPPHAPQRSQLDELIDNLNWALGAIRKAVESESGCAILDRLARLAHSACIVNGLTLDSEGWAALLNLANGRSFSALKNRRKVPAHKPGQTLMFAAADLLRATDGIKSRARVSGLNAKREEKTQTAERGKLKKDKSRNETFRQIEHKTD